MKDDSFNKKKGMIEFFDEQPIEILICFVQKSCQKDVNRFEVKTIQKIRFLWHFMLNRTHLKGLTTLVCCLEARIQTKSSTKPNKT